MSYRVLGLSKGQAIKYNLILPKNGECLMSENKRNLLRKKRKRKRKTK